MISAIQRDNYDEIMEDLNNMVFNIVEPKSVARNVWAEVVGLASEGATELELYNYVRGSIATTT